MKRIEAYIKPHKLDAVSRALHHTPGVGGVTITDVRGWGRGKGQDEQTHPSHQVSDFEPHLKLEVVCRSDAVERIVSSIREAAHTGLVGDGIIVVSSVDDAVRIRTGASAEDAL